MSSSNGNSAFTQLLGEEIAVVHTCLTGGMDEGNLHFSPIITDGFLLDHDEANGVILLSDSKNILKYLIPISSILRIELIPQELAKAPRIIKEGPELNEDVETVGKKC